MFLTPKETIMMIIVIALGTQITRWLPFLIFPEKKEPPEIMSYLGKVLPIAMMGLLCVFCLKNVSLVDNPHGLPELISIIVVILLHKWKGNTFLSIGAGTLLYMLLVQLVFA